MMDSYYLSRQLLARSPGVAKTGATIVGRTLLSTSGIASSEITLPAFTTGQQRTLYVSIGGCLCARTIVVPLWAPDPLPADMAAWVASKIALSPDLAGLVQVEAIGGLVRVTSRHKGMEIAIQGVDFSVNPLTDGRIIAPEIHNMTPLVADPSTIGYGKVYPPSLTPTKPPGETFLGFAVVSDCCNCGCTSDKHCTCGKACLQVAIKGSFWVRLANREPGGQLYYTRQNGLVIATTAPPGGGIVNAQIETIEGDLALVYL
jgi:hypothetical protein